jgi:hypothetical protein
VTAPLQVVCGAQVEDEDDEGEDDEDEDDELRAGAGKGDDAPPRKKLRR